MPNRIPTTRAEWTAWTKEVEQKSPARFQFCILALAAVLMVAHYTIDEQAYHPEVSLWKARAFWSGAWMYAVVPFINWFVWRLVSGGQLKTLKPILMMAALLCVASALVFCVPSMLHSIEAMHLHTFKSSIEKWHWFTFRYDWRYSTPLVLVIGNLILLWRWRISRSALSAARSGGEGASRSNVVLKAVAIIAAIAAFVVTAVHLVLPRLPANQDVVNLAAAFLVKPRLESDFNYLIQSSFSSGQPLAPLLTHLELADLQRHQFYPNLDDDTFQQYILSPQIDSLPLDEVNWRRTLWENFYPRIRHETDPVEAAQIVVRFLRERVGIDSSYNFRVGVETIWTEQMTDEIGFERIYVAALRSVGIASRLNDNGQAELLEGNQWQSAPQVLISSFEDKKFPVPRNGLVNFRNWNVEDWPN